MLPCKSYSVVALRCFLAFVSLYDCNIRAFRASVLNVLVQFFPVVLRPFSLLNLHLASRKGFVVGFKNDN